MKLWRLRYVPGTDPAIRFPLLRYPRTWNPPTTRKHAETIRQAMPDPTRWELVEDGK